MPPTPPAGALPLHPSAEQRAVPCKQCTAEGEFRIHNEELRIDLVHPRAGRRFAACRMQSIRGKRRKAPEEKACFLSRRFLVFVTPVVLFLFVPHASCEKTPFDTIVCRTPGPGVIPLVRGTGGAEPPALVSLGRPQSPLTIPFHFPFRKSSAA